MSYSLGNYGVAPQSIGNERFNQIVKAELAITAWRWGKQWGGVPPMLMIAHCLANRVKNGWGSWLQVIEGIPKFAGTTDLPTGYPDQWNRDFSRLLPELDAVVDQTARDLVNGGLYWADLTKVEREWFLQSISQNPLHHRVADCGGTLVFWD